MTALLVYFLGPAHACGGLFCSSTPSISTPIAQNAERIVFEVGDGYVDAHVQVFYEGPADEFAWVVPVPAEPELFPSQEALFDRLVATTAPTFRLDDFTRDGCSRPVRIGCSGEAGLGSLVPPALDGGVGIVNEAEVGPYETLTLEASDSRALIRFLQDAGYDLPLALAEVLAPYVADGGYFVALRLAKHRDVGDIEPLGMRYAGSQPSIPITLTSIAATDAMPVEVYVFGDHRAVPTSYLHVEINEALVDWWSGAANYYDVVGQAVDEAGGHAFVTDYFGEPPSRGRRLRWNVNVDNLLAQDRLRLWLDVVTVGGVELDAHAAGVIARAVGAPGDVDPVEFVDCPSCFGWDDEDFDSEALTLAFYDEVLVYLERARRRHARPASAGVPATRGDGGGVHRIAGPARRPTHRPARRERSGNRARRRIGLRRGDRGAQPHASGRARGGLRDRPVAGGAADGDGAGAVSAEAEASVAVSGSVDRRCIRTWDPLEASSTGWSFPGTDP